MSAPTAKARRKSQKRGRAAARTAFVANRQGVFDARRLQQAMARLLAPPDKRILKAVLPTSDVQRWVPIGPSVVRLGQAEGSPRVTGRVRDLAVSPDGTRAYAATAKGGVWYSGDGGATWEPVGGADRPWQAGGNPKACGCLMVSFGANPGADHVMVGTGETTPWLAPTGHSQAAGVGVLAALGPAATAVGSQPWEPDDGIAQLAGLGVFRLARNPASVAGTAAGAAVDRVVAGTSAGLFLGTRSHIVGPPARDGYTWAKVAALDAFVGGALPITDALWLPGGANGRLLVAVDSSGVAFTDDLGAHWAWVGGMGAVVGRLSLAFAAGTRCYVLGDVGGVATVWQIANASATPPAAVVVPGTPAGLFGTQRDYDQAIAVDVVGATDRVYLGGSAVQPTAGGAWSASLYCLDTPAPPGAPGFVPAPTLSDIGAPPAAGADQAGLVGNNVHADVHTVRLAGPAGPARQVWVGCDGGIFVSAQAGRVNSYLSRSTGLASLEVGFHAPHPSSSHFVAIGCQDNGTQVRVGDTVWDETMQGDGGGVAFHPTFSQVLIAQYIQGTWLGRPSSVYRDPIHRAVGGTYEGAVPDREFSASAFYAGASAVANGTLGRVALGTNRVWVTDNLAAAVPNTWRVLPSAPGGAATDPRPGGSDTPASQVSGTFPALGSVIQVRWTSPTVLLAIYQTGLVRYTQNPVSKAWVSTVLIPGSAGAPNPANTMLTDVNPVPGTQDFYLTTTGEVAPAAALETCFFFDAATSTFIPTNLRHALDVANPPLGPLDPAYAVVVDPAANTNVYVGTLTGVWHGVRAPGVANHAWTFFANGLPQATVQDLSIWVDPSGAAGSPRLLRAAVQSRGVWEVDLSANEVRRSYVRVHARDDRRRFPTPMQNPRRNPTAPIERTYASPDITIRPAGNPAAPPTWQLPAPTVLSAANVLPYQLWTFQTAFRWHYPSILANGQWSDQLADLILLHRNVIGQAGGPVIDANLWNTVVATRLTAAGAPTGVAPDPLAVYRSPWQAATALNVAATEVDLMELVTPPRIINDVWQVYKERSTVEVLMHFRDTRPLAPSDAFAVVMWRSGPSLATLLATNPAPLAPYAQGLVGGPAQPVPAGWNVQPVPVGGGVQHRLPVGLDARLPRAVSVDVDLSGVTAGHFVMLLALVGSSVDAFAAPVVGAPADMGAFVRAWPYAAMRIVRVQVRPP